MATPGTELTPLWSTSDTEASVAPPVVVGDTCISFLFDAVVGADIYTGDTRWSHDVQTAVTRVVVADRQLVMLDGTDLFALDPATGKDRRIGDGGFTGDVQGRDGLLLAYDSGGALCRLDLASGAVLWRTQAWDQTPGPLALNDDGSAAFFICQQQLFAVNTGSGEVRWVFAPDDPFSGPDHRYQMLLDVARRPLVAAGVVVAPGTYVYGVDEVRGVQLWANSERCVPGCAWSDPLLSAAGGAAVLGGCTSNAQARVRSIDLATGGSRWTTFPDPGVAGYQVGQLAMGDGEVWVADNIRLRRLDLGSGAVRAEYPGLGSGVGIALGNATVFIPTGNGIQAQGYGAQDALFFNGVNAHVAITMANGAMLAFTGEVTVEAWIRTNQGGELLSSHAAGGPAGNRIRVNITPEGRVRFAVLNQASEQANLVVTAQTNVCDGCWHHVAVVRSAANASVIFVDGCAVRCSTGGTATPLAIGAQDRLLVGAVQEKLFKPYTEAFRGLVLDLRVWNRALTLPLVQDRMGKVLRGDEPGLVGYWTFDVPRLQDIQDAVAPHDHVTTPVRVQPWTTDLVLDQSLFPYLLSDQAVHWPYQGYWSVRGEHAMLTHAAATDGVACYGTENQVYAVAMFDGRRRWNIPAPRGTGHPVAGDGAIYYADDREVFAVRADTGAQLWMADLPTPGFPAREDPPVPVLDGATLVLCDGGGNVVAYERATGGRRWAWPSGAAPAGLCMTPPDASGTAPVVYCYDPARLTALALTGPQAGQPLWRTPVSAAQTMAMAPVCSAGGMLFLLDTQDTEVVAWSELAWRATEPGSRVERESWRRPLAQVDASAPAGGRATGVTALKDANLLVVTTDYGVVYGLEYATGQRRWRYAIPAGSGPASGMIHPAVIAPHGVYCPAASGVVVALDAATGTPTGRFDIGEKILTCSIVQAGAVYFGCDDSDGRSVGALHSIVFGETSALRLGAMDTTGQPVPGSGAYVSVQGTDFSAFDVFNVRECCAEAWVNTRAGGDIVSVCPAEGDRFGLRLWLQPDGAIHFHAIDKPAGGAWEGVHAWTAATAACDGRWHHVAVARNGSSDLRIYLDGVLQDIAPVAIDPAPPAVLAADLRLCLGADATAPGVSGSFFGLLGEVRLWNACLVASEIADRMHTQLRGDEGALVAYWNFDSGGLHDEHGKLPDGRLVGADASFWLTDLVFARPTYPYLQTSARLTQVGEDGLPPSNPLSETRYALDVVAHRADGTLLPNQAITLWYRALTNDPDSIIIRGPNLDRTILPVAPEDKSFDPRFCAQATTDAQGRVEFEVATLQLGHGPMLLLNAGYMAPNERSTVSVLIDNQKLAPPLPPSLSARSSLVQDYSHAPGDRIGPDRDVSTWRTVIQARNTDGTARPGERVEIWARNPVVLQAAGQSSRVDAWTSQTFRCDANGDLVLVVVASDIKTPELLLCAGFMHRNDRLVVAADHEAHTQLAAVQPADLTTPKATRWSPDGVPPQPLLAGGYETHSTEIAGAVRHVMAGTPAAGGSGLRARLRQGTPRLAARLAGDPLPEPPAPPADAARILRTMQHIARTEPLTPDAMQLTLPQGAVGFRISCSIDPATGYGDPTSWRLDYHDAAQGAVLNAQYLAQAAQSQQLGGFFDDLWSSVVDVVDTVAEAIKSVAITIANTVTVAIEYVSKTVVTVINSVAQALAVVGEFFRQIGLAIMKVIEFLRFLFDWGAIVRTHRVLSDALNRALDGMQQLIAEQRPALKAALHAPFEEMRRLLAESPLHPTPTSAQANRPAGAADLGACDSVKGRMVRDKTQEHGAAATMAPPVPGGDLPDPGALLAQLPGKLGTALGSAITSITGLQNFDMGSLLAAIGDLLDAVLLAAEAVVDGLVDAMTSGLATLKGALNFELRIPFLSELYAFITGGGKLTVLDLTTLALAVPVNIAYGLATGNHFADDMQDMPARASSQYAVVPQTSSPAPRPTPAPTPTPSPADRTRYRNYDIFYGIVRSFHGISIMGADMEKMMRVAAPAPVEVEERIAIGVRGLTGVLMCVALYNASPSDQVERRWLGASDELLYIGGVLHCVRTFELFRNPAGLVDTWDRTLVIAGTVYGLFGMAWAFQGYQDGALDGKGRAEGCLAFFPEAYRFLTVPWSGNALASRALVVVLPLMTLACTIGTLALHYTRPRPPLADQAPDPRLLSA